MGVFQINLGESHVALDHFQGGVAEEMLELQGLATVAEEVDGEGVTEAVGMGGLNARALAEALDEPR